MSNAVDYIEGWEPLQAGSFATVAVGYGYTSLGGANILINGTEARNGSKCLRINQTSFKYTLFAVTPISTRGLGCAFKFTGTPDYFEPIFGFYLSSGQRIVVGLNAASVLCIFLNNALIEAGTVVLNSGVYYYGELSYNAATTAYEVRLNSTEDVLSGNSGATVSTINGIMYGYDINVGGAQTIRYVDDCYSTNDGSLLGDRVADYRFPTSDGVLQDYTPASGVDGFAMIDNVPVNPAEYIEAVLAGDISDFNFSGLGVTAYQVDAVMVIANRLRTGATVETDRARITVGGTPYNAATETVPQTTAEWSRSIWGVNPDTGVDWLPSEIQTSFNAGMERVS